MASVSFPNNNGSLWTVRVTATVPSAYPYATLFAFTGDKSDPIDPVPVTWFTSSSGDTYYKTDPEFSGNSFSIEWPYSIAPGEQFVANLTYAPDNWNSGKDAKIAGTINNRPDPFYWSSSITQGKPISGLTAAEWSRFCTNIDKMLTYKGQSLSTYSPARPSSGSLKVVSTSQAGTYTIGYYCRQAARAIRQMGGSVSDPSSTGTLTAAYLTSLQNALNSIK